MILLYGYILWYDGVVVFWEKLLFKGFLFDKLWKKIKFWGFFLCKNEKVIYVVKLFWEKLLIYFIIYLVCLNGMIKIFMIRI